MAAPAASASDEGGAGADTVGAMPGDGEPLVLAAMEVKRLQPAALVRLAVAVAQAARTAGATQYATADGVRGRVGDWMPTVPR